MVGISNSIRIDVTQRGVVSENPFTFTVRTDNTGTSGNDQFQFTGAVGEYDVEAYQGGSLVSSFSNLVNEQTITLPSAGTYELRVTPQAAGFDKFRFDNGGDKDKLLKILDWGLYGVNEPNQSFAFYGCTNLTEIAGNGAWFDVITDGTRTFQDCSLSTLPSDMTLPLLVIGTVMFTRNNLTELPSGMTLPLLENGRFMFQDNQLTSLPSGMELPLLTNGISMFQDNQLTSLPSGMTLPSLDSASSMFQGNTINTTRYSQLLIDLESGNPNNNVSFHGGNSTYNTSGQTARNILTTTPRNWTITDGGLVI